MLICIVKFIEDTGEMLSGLTGIEGSCDVRWAHVLSYVIFSICGRSCMCEVQGVYLPTHVVWCCKECSIQRGSIWVYRTWNHKELDCVVWVVPRLILVCCNVQEPHASCKFYEEGPMGGNQNVWSFWRNKTSSRAGGWCIMRKGGRPGYCILLVMM